MFSNLFKKSDKPSAAVFVDYEHWYYGYKNIFSMKPNVQEWYDELTEEYNVKKLMFFGDFNGSAIEKELPKLEKITKNVVHTASTKDGVDKDFTDFIILDAIYREAAKKDSPDEFVIFTGDAHFNLAIKYLRELKKKVIIYGVKRSLSIGAAWHAHRLFSGNCGAGCACAQPAGRVHHKRRHLAESDDAQPVHRRGLLGRHGYAARIDRHFNLLYTGAGLSCRTGTDFLRAENFHRHCI